MKKYAIIVAGGKGLRMRSDQPKQFLEIDGKPILAITISRFLDIQDVNVIVVLPADFVSYWGEQQEQIFPDKEIQLVVGGKTRTESVRAGLDSIKDDGVVAIHDAVRPFVSASVINSSFDSAEKFGSGVVAVDLKDSLRKKSSDGSLAVNRENYVIVQTPQTFRISEIKEAYKNAEESYSDDATVYEKSGYVVKLVEGDYGNIKITTPEDLK